MQSVLIRDGKRLCASGESLTSASQNRRLAGGYFGDPKETGFRFRRAISYYGGDSSANTFATGPVEGVVVFVNLNTKKVFKFIDTEWWPRPKSAAVANSGESDHPREALKRLQIIQPDGTSFRVQNNEVSWQNWRFRFALNGREDWCYTPWATRIAESCALSCIADRFRNGSS